jgi:hypothetical protein
MKKAWKLKDRGIHDIFSIIIGGFPIVEYRIYYFGNGNRPIKFLWIFGKHIFTKDVKKKGEIIYE